MGLGQGHEQTEKACHRLDDALRIFLDTRPLIAEDQRVHYGERRLQVLGAVDGRVLFAVCTWRGGVCRLISARRGQCARKTTL
jgi:uncharacterized DUF497 family protein